MAFLGQNSSNNEHSTDSTPNEAIHFTVLKSSQPSDTICDNGKVTLSPWGTGQDKQGDALRSGFSRLSYGVGHVLNDLCSAMWFSHLLVYFDKVVELSATEAGILLLIGQIVDGLATPVVGIESDSTSITNYGKRKLWHLGGTIAVVFTFPFIFNLCIGCENASRWSLFIYYVPFIVIFQTGWAAVQISHLSLIPELASTSDEKVILNALR